MQLFTYIYCSICINLLLDMLINIVINDPMYENKNNPLIYIFNQKLFRYIFV